MTNRGEIEEKLSRGTEFSAWEEIKACLETLKSFGIVYSIHRGDKLMFDSPCIYSHVELRCKFGIRMRSKILYRSHQKYYGALQCNSRICIRYNKLTSKLRIVHSSFDHTDKDGIAHTINEETAGHIPELRRLDNTQKGFIDSIDSLGVPSQKIAHTLRKRAAEKGEQSFITSKDIRNYISKSKSVSGVSEAQRVITVLEKQRKQGAIIDYHVDQNSNELQHVFFQSRQMQESASLFSSVLLLDGTYRLSNSGYVLYIWLGIDNTLRGRMLAWSLISHENVKNVTQAILTFFKHNPQCTQDTKSIIVDKSFVELSSLHIFSDKIPNVDILLCAVHTLRNFDKLVNNMTWSGDENKKLVSTDLDDIIEYFDKEDCHSLKSDTQKNKTAKNHHQTIRQSTRSILHRMLYTSNKGTFSDLYSKLLNCPYLPGKFLDDFRANWGDCKELWAKCFRTNIHNLLIDDNNRLEALNMRIKKSVTSLYTSLDNVVSNLLTFEETHYAIVNEMNFKNIMKPRVPKTSDIPDLGCIYSICTEEAIVFLEEEFKNAKSLKLSKRDESSLLWAVRCGSNVYTTGLKKCACSFFQHLFLPCSHLMAVHQKEGYPAVAPDDIPNRWLCKPVIQFSRKTKYNDTHKCKPGSGEEVLDDSGHDVLGDSGHDVLGDSGHDVLADSGHDVLNDSAHDILCDFDLPVDIDIKAVDNCKGILNSENNKYSITNQKNASDTKTKLEASEKYNKTMAISKQIAQHLSLVSNEEFHIKFNVLKHLCESWSLDFRETKRRRMSSETHLPQNDIPINSINTKTQPEEIIISRNKKVLGRPKGSRNKQKSVTIKASPKRARIPLSQQVKQINDLMIKEVSDSDQKLSENTIDHFQNMIKTTYPQAHGLEPINKADNLDYSRHRGVFTQIIPLPDNLYVVLFGDSDKSECHIYASFALNIQSNPEILKNPTRIDSQTWSLIMQVTSLMEIEMTVGKSVELFIHDSNITHKNNSGIIAIATAIELCRTGSRNMRSFKVDASRKHLAKCILENAISQCPSSVKIMHNDYITMDLQVYCYCRKPEVALDIFSTSPETMVECQKCLEWFHQTCIVHSGIDDLHTFTCKKCNNTMSDKERFEIFLQRHKPVPRPILLSSEIEHVDPLDLISYMEVDRNVVQKDKMSLPILTESIRKEGIKEPLELAIKRYSCDNIIRGTAFLYEGNTRLAAAINLGLHWVPLKTHYNFIPSSITPLNKLVPAVPESMPNYPSPSDFGFITKESTGNLPSWGGRGVNEWNQLIHLSNTCTIDNFLAIFLCNRACFFKVMTDFSSFELEETNQAVIQRLLKSVELLSKGLDFEGKYHFFGKHDSSQISVDLYGSEYEIFISKFTFMFQTTEIFSCSQPDCNFVQQFVDGKTAVAIKPFPSPNDSAFLKSLETWHQLGSETDKPCPNCTTKLSIRRIWKQQPPPFLIYQPHACNMNNLHYEDIPISINVLTTPYILIGITFHNNAHFTCIIRIQNKWLRYNGLQNIKITPIKDNEKLGSIGSIVYLRED